MNRNFLLWLEKGKEEFLSENLFLWLSPPMPGGIPGGIPIVFISTHEVVTQFVNVSFFCVPVHEDTTHASLSRPI